VIIYELLDETNDFGYPQVANERSFAVETIKLTQTTEIEAERLRQNLPKALTYVRTRDRKKHFELINLCSSCTTHQSMDSKILREYITQEGNRHEVAARPPVAVTNAVSWRTEGIKHRKNEIFLDVVEKLNLLVSSNGTVMTHTDLKL